MNRLEDQLRSFDPSVAAPLLPDTDVWYAVVDSPLGALVLAATDSGVIACSYREESAVTRHIARAVSPGVTRSARRLDPVRRELDAYFEGRLRAFSVPIDLVLASPFARGVLHSLGARAPYGAVTTYSELARATGYPQAPRAVGGALARNPVCILMPCHRVVRADGDLGGYAGGAEAKQRLLALEGATLAR